MCLVDLLQVCTVPVSSSVSAVLTRWPRDAEDPLLELAQQLVLVGKKIMTTALQKPQMGGLGRDPVQLDRRRRGEDPVGSAVVEELRNALETSDSLLGATQLSREGGNSRELHAPRPSLGLLLETAAEDLRREEGDCTSPRVANQDHPSCAVADDFVDEGEDPLEGLHEGGPHPAPGATIAADGWIGRQPLCQKWEEGLVVEGFAIRPAGTYTAVNAGQHDDASAVALVAVAN
mmetsp:Transcript_119772/g.310629  ORF Transcript_119772/g.310629 Transcript_119772/m.310629 type:complete len:233 (+) Transcript_119772:314-1012(+)